MLTKADLRARRPHPADLSDVDARHATFAGARLAGAKLTGAKVAGLVGTGAPARRRAGRLARHERGGDGTGRISNGEIPLAALGPGAGGRGAEAPAARRYFGRGDVLRNATLTFEPGARVEIDSLFENCTITARRGDASSSSASAGVLADCNIAGAGSITINGQFFERESPGIVGPRELVVSREGALVASVRAERRR